MAERRRTFAPVVLAGLAAAALAAVAATNTWVGGSAAAAPAGNVAGVQGTAGESPLAAALGLVLLAAWGVVLVTRGGFRRAMTLLAVAAALAYAVTTALAPSQLRDAVEEQVGAVDGSSTGRDLGVTGWWWVAMVAAVISVVATVAAARWAPRWPEMGARYDAPAGAAEARRGTPETGIDMWKALDEGRDPTT